MRIGEADGAFSAESRFAAASADRRVEFIQYNVLSSHLCGHAAYPRCHRNALDPAQRLARVTNLLAERLSSGGPAVVALQEVTADWAPTLRRFFKNLGMRSIFTEHGCAWDGNMGVLLAFTTRDFRLVRSESVLIADVSSFVAPPKVPVARRKSAHRSTGWTWCSVLAVSPPLLFVGGLFMRWCERELTVVMTLYGTLACAFAWFCLVWTTDKAEPADARTDSPVALLSTEARAKRFKQWLKSRPSSCPIAVAMSKRNRMLWMRLAWNDVRQQEGSHGASSAAARSSCEFAVATYHMPCVFRDQRVMVLHATLFAQRAAALAACANGATLPLVLLGDFNSQPGSDAYRALTTPAFDGVAEAALPAWLFAGGSPWRYGMRSAAPFRSCYAAYAGEEPETTNYTYQSYSADGAFSGTLDYIFVSPQWRVVDVLRLPGVEELKREGAARGQSLEGGSEGYLPSVTRPSDHLCIAATARLRESH